MGRDIYTLLYLSVASVRLAQNDLTNLLGTCRQYNAAHGLTGLLIYANGHWIEFLEGDQKDVDGLMTQIEQDPRHRDIEVIEKGTASAREFQDWSMAFLEHATPEVRALPGYSTFLEESIDWEAPEQTGRGLQMLNYFKTIMLASDDSISNLARSAEIQRQAPVLAGRIAAAKRRS